MWLFQIPLTFGHVVRKETSPLPVPARMDDSIQRENIPMNLLYHRRSPINSDDQDLANHSATSIILDCSTTEDCSPRSPSSPLVDSVRYNGSISSAQMILLLVAISSSTTVAVLLSHDFKPVIGMLTLSSYMVVGLVVMIMFFKFRRLLLMNVTNSDEPADIERDNLTLIGIVIFYLLVCLLDMFYIVSSLSCHEVWTSCSNGDVYFSFFVEVFFHVARIAYLGVKTTFCITFHRSKFKDNVLTRYGLMFLQAVNISLWFDALIQESVDLSGHNDIQVDAYSQKCDINESNFSTEVLECLAHNSTTYVITNTIVRPICLPFTIEFTLLVGEFLIFCFYHYDNQPVICTPPPSDKRPANGLNANPLGRDEATSSNCGPTDASLTPPDENSPLLQHTGNRCTSSCTLLAQIWICFVIALNVLLCVFTILCKFQSTAASYKNSALYVLFTFWIGMTIAVVAGYYVSKSFRVNGQRMRFSSMDYLLLVTSFGPLAYNACTCIAVYGHPTVANGNVDDATVKHVTKAFYITMQVFNTIQVHLQTTFSLYAARITVDKQRWNCDAGLFKAVILYLAVSNGVLWLTATFGGYEFGGVQMEEGLSLQAAYFGRGGWAVIYNIVVPLLLFYRFNSWLVFTRIYRRLS